MDTYRQLTAAGTSTRAASGLTGIARATADRDTTRPTPTPAGATRALERLRHLGLVCDVHHQDDQRVHLVALTPCGEELVARLRSGAWLRIDQAVSAICRDLDGPLLTQLAALEDALEDRGLDVHTDELETR